MHHMPTSGRRCSTVGPTYTDGVTIDFENATTLRTYTYCFVRGCAEAGCLNGIHPPLAPEDPAHPLGSPSHHILIGDFLSISCICLIVFPVRAAAFAACRARWNSTMLNSSESLHQAGSRTRSPQRGQCESVREGFLGGQGGYAG